MAHGPAIFKGGKEYPGELTAYVIMTCIVAAAGGLIFGYDIGISGGVTSMDSFLLKFFPSVYRKKHADSSTNAYCQYDSVILTMFTSSLYLAALVASLVASWVTRTFGRRKSMLFGGVLFLLGAALNAAAQEIWYLIVGRLLLGLGIGFSIQAVPLYLSEMAPYKHRGKLNIGFQMSITIGILFANIMNWAFSKISGGWGWRLSLGGAAVPAIIFIAGSFFLPDTPNSLVERGRLDEAKARLRRIRGVQDVEEEFEDLVNASVQSKKVEHPWKNLWFNRKYRPHLVISLLIPSLQQLTGINVIMFYAPVLFNTIGMGSNTSLISAVITGLVNVIATIVSIYGVDKWGRRSLFFEGGVQMVISQIVIGASIWSKFGWNGTPGELPMWYSIAVLTFICIYVSAFAWSWGPLGWLVPSEIFPLEIRSAAQSVVVVVNMFFTFLIAQIFLMMLCHFKFVLFFIFAVFVVGMTAFIYFYVPETKGIPIEEMGKVWENHKIWSKYVERDSDVELEEGKARPL